VELGRWTGSDKDVVKELIVLGIPKKLKPVRAGPNPPLEPTTG
jgi:hypothetical protein